jgi:predicted MPP superfamily phosphohydrolase
VVEEVTVRIPGLPTDLENLRIAHISDMHIKAVGEHERRLQARLKALQPDLIAVTGDIIEHAAAYEIWTERATTVRTFLQGLWTPPYGVWATRGNTDISRYGGHSDFLVRQIRQTRTHLLINESQALAIGEAELYLAGVDFADLPPNFSADYHVASYRGNRVLAAGPCEGNAFTHYFPDDRPLQGYEFSGRLTYTDPDGGTGILFGSRFPFGENRFYRIRTYKGVPDWSFSAKGVTVEDSETPAPVDAQANVWYRFRIRWEPLREKSGIQVKLWPERQIQPSAWQIETYAQDPGNEETFVGFWSVGPGSKYYDDLEMRTLDGELLWAVDFEEEPLDKDPAHWLDFGINKGNVERALRHVPSEATVILLAHSPDAIYEAMAAGVDLVLSGHTHGGQVRLPVIGPLYVNSDVGRRYNQGLFHLDGTQLYVNRGIGTRWLRVRFLCPPEITVITLKSTT